jgi:hypothetical protein
MALDASLQLLKDRQAFAAAVTSGPVPELDFSGEEINFAFSGLSLNHANFATCKLQGSSFSNSQLSSCNFEASNWTGVDFTNAYFNGCRLSGIKNAHQAIGLHTVHGDGINMNFETAERPWWNRLLDWERIGALGRLPLFTASSVALVLLPIYFYILDVYNRHVQAWKAALDKHAEAEGLATIGKEALDKFGSLPIPALSLEALISALLLFVASFLYALACPARIKQFSSEQWRYELHKPMVTYWPLAWMHRLVRMICAASYLVGGILAILIIGSKLLGTAKYILRNM